MQRPGRHWTGSVAASSAAPFVRVLRLRGGAARQVEGLGAAARARGGRRARRAQAARQPRLRPRGAASRLARARRLCSGAASARVSQSWAWRHAAARSQEYLWTCTCGSGLSSDTAGVLGSARRLADTRSRGRLARPASSRWPAHAGDRPPAARGSQRGPAGRALRPRLLERVRALERAAVVRLGDRQVP
jgi:hypothetical protein